MLRVVYGALGDGESNISNFKVKVETMSDGILYSRYDASGNMVASTRLTSSVSLQLLPIEPVAGAGGDVVECIYVKLETPLVVESRAEITLRVPVDYGIVAYGSNGSNILVDSFPEASIPYKLALYGPPTEGFICRYYRESWNPARIESPGLAWVNVRIRNELGSIARVSSIVIPLDMVKVYYKQGTWIAAINNVIMTLESRNTARINVDEDPPSADFDQSPDIVKRDGLTPSYALGREAFRMLWGY